MSENSYAKCFVSYCHDDVPKEAIEEIVSKLRKAAKGEIIFYFDEDNKTGEDLKEFMNNIISCDSVVIICSPEYKKKIGIDGENINYEFSLISKKYEDYKRIKDDPNDFGKLPMYNFSILPIIITDVEKGKINKKDAYPDYLDNHNIIYKRYSFISKKTKNNVKLLNGTICNFDSEYQKKLVSIKKNTKTANEENKKIIQRVVSKTLAIKLSRPISNENKNYRLSKLIKYTKAETNGNLGEVYCRTDFYNELIQQNKKIFVGRKGSGKSQTILQFIDENQEAYKGVIRIDANNIKDI